MESKDNAALITQEDVENKNIINFEKEQGMLTQQIQNLQIQLNENVKTQISNIDHSLLKENENIHLQDKYQMFNDWCKSEGVIMPKLEYPAIFKDDLIGVRCTQDIEHREAYLFVPYKMLLSVKKTVNHEVLGPIILDNPKLFGEDENCDWEQITLTLAIFYEMVLGSKSYWYPYIRMLPTVGFSCAWSRKEKAMAQDECLIKYLDEYNFEINMHWYLFEKLLKKYQRIFPSTFVDKELFLNIYAQVCTRCFGYGVDSCSMIPMADNLNHSCVNVSYEMINVQLHKNGEEIPNYYRVRKFLNDYTPAFETHKISEEEFKQYELNIKGRFDRKLFAHNNQALGIENLKENIKIKHIWEVPFYLDEYDEDNDSDEDDDSDEQNEKNKKKTIKLRENHALEYFIKKEKDYLRKIQKNQQKRNQNEDQKQQFNLEKKIIQTLKECDWSEMKINELLAKQLIQQNTNYEPDNQNLQVDDQILNLIEYIKVEKEGKVKQREKKWIEEGEDEESDEDFDWIVKQEKENYELNEKETYFTLCNEMRKPMKAGQQAWNCYGDRNNAFLLVHYGFCFQDNLHNSFNFNVKLDLDFNKNITPSMDEMLEMTKNLKDIQDIRLKNNQFNEILIAYIRSCMKEGFLQKNRGTQSHKILLTKAQNIEFEQICLKRYQEIIQYLIEKVENVTTLEQDIEILEQLRQSKQQLEKNIIQKSQNEIFAVIYRSERKKILRNQLSLIKWLRSFLSQSYQIRSLFSMIDENFESCKEVDELYKQMYLSYMENEKDKLNDNLEIKDGSIFKNVEHEQSYWYRRLFIREYLYQIYRIHEEDAFK